MNDVELNLTPAEEAKAEIISVRFSKLIEPLKTNRALRVADNIHFSSIARMCIGMHIGIQLPKPSCKHCNGRGYTGIDTATKSPIPCNCIYTDEMGNPEHYRKFNRDDRRGSAKRSKTRMMSAKQYDDVMADIVERQKEAELNGQ